MANVKYIFLRFNSCNVGLDLVDAGGGGGIGDDDDGNGIGWKKEVRPLFKGRLMCVRLGWFW